jgi:hypothetical protein
MLNELLQAEREYYSFLIFLFIKSVTILIEEKLLLFTSFFLFFYLTFLIICLMNCTINLRLKKSIFKER